MLGLEGQNRGGDRGVREENNFCKNNANRSIVSLLFAAVFCLGGGGGRRVKGFVEIKILDQNLTLLKMI